MCEVRNSFVGFMVRKKIRRSSRLKSIAVLLALVTSPLVLALVFSESMISGISMKYVYLSDGHIQSSERPAQDMRILRTDETLSSYVIVYSSDATSQIRLKGVEDSYFEGERQKHIDLKLVEDSSSLKKIILSESLCRKLDVKLGDRVAIMFSPKQNTTVRPILVRVAGVYSSGYEALDDNLGFTSLENARQWFNEDPVFETVLYPEYENESSETAYDLSLRNFRTWQNLNSSIYSNFVSSRQMITMVLLLISIMASVYVAIVSNQMVNEDLYETSQLKLLGLKQSDIYKAGVLSVMTVTVIGCVCGLVIGSVLSFSLLPVLKALSRSGLPVFSYYLLDFDLVYPIARISTVLLVLVLLSLVSVSLSLKKTRRISPMQLFTRQ